MKKDLLSLVTSSQRPASDLQEAIQGRVVGQERVIQSIVPYVRMFQAGLSPEGRPAGVFLLLGPTGTGKTRTVEALAEVLHGSDKHMLKIDCGEFQMEHEVAKLIGAPPGYLGHRETQPVLSQQKLTSVTSENCKLSIVLFDEVEKAAPSMARLLLGVLDKAALRLGDNSTVNFENSLIFLTSNLGAAAMMKELQPEFGFQAVSGPDESQLDGKLEQIGMAAVRRKFAPEFVNRLDVVATYRPLSDQALAAIVDLQLEQLQLHINRKLDQRSFQLKITDAARAYLREQGTSKEYGARELKRVILRRITQPLANLLADGHVSGGMEVLVEHTGDAGGLSITPLGKAVQRPRPRVLIVEDNLDLLLFLERSMEGCGWELVTAQSVLQAQELLQYQNFDAAVIDYLLPDGNGVDLSRKIRRRNPVAPIVIMSGINLTPRHDVFCQEAVVHVMRKPFLPGEVTRLLYSRLRDLEVAA